MSVTDIETPTRCGRCDELISDSDMNAGEYAMSFDGKTAYHSRCKAFVPPFQVIGWYICETCRHWPWDCTCTPYICTECELTLEDAVADPVCMETNGEHKWQEVEPDCRE